MATVNAIKTIETPKRNSMHLTLAGSVGAIVGCGARYVLPLKDELKQTGDSFFSSAKMAARCQKRSMLKFAGIGAVVAMGIGLISKLIKNEQKSHANTIQYNKLGALIDAPDYACEIMWWGE